LGENALTSDLVMRRAVSKDPGPEDPALTIPRGDLVYRHLTICGALEYWSGGVMEKTLFSSLSENRSLEKIPKFKASS
jgi:hypothetical protein